MNNGSVVLSGEKEKSTVKQRAAICMLDGTVRHGTVVAAMKEDAAVPLPAEISGEEKQFYFEFDDDCQRVALKMDLVKAIHIGEGEPELHTSPRFFDSAPIPSSLWVRAAFFNGEIVEGMIANTWSAFNGPLVELRLSGEQFYQKQVLIPRTSIAELQVITTR
jgi:hypothetical protein